MKFTSVLLAGTTSTWQVEKSTTDSILNYPVKKYENLLNLGYENYKSDFLTIIATAIPRENLLFEFSESSSTIYCGIEHKTMGALSTLAMLVDNIPENYPIVVSPVDGIVQLDLVDFIFKMNDGNFDCGLVCFYDSNPMFSYARLVNDHVVEIAEKKIISNMALSGVHYFRNIQTLLKCIEWSYLNNASTNGLYYISTAINGLIANNARVGIFEIDRNDYFRYSTQEECFLSESRRLN